MNEASKVRSSSPALTKITPVFSIADLLTTELVSSGFKLVKTNSSTPEWRSERGWFKLTYTRINLTSLSYNIQYDLKPNHELRVRGEFDAVTSAQVIRTLCALLTIN